MSFWSGEKLLANQSVLKEFDPTQIDTNAYNLRMGSSYFVTEGSEEKTKVTLKPNQQFFIPAGQFAYLMSREELCIPNDAMALISMRTGIKFKGLINVSGFHVDPGYKGKLIYAVYNAGPSSIYICEGDEIFKIWFADLDRKSKPKYIYQGSGQADISNNLIEGMSKEIYSLQSLADKMRLLESNVDQKFAEQKPTIDNLTFIWRAMILGTVAAIIASILTFALPILFSISLSLDKEVGETLSTKKTAPASVEDTQK